MTLIGFGTYGMRRLQAAIKTSQCWRWHFRVRHSGFWLWNFHKAIIFMGIRARSHSGSRPRVWACSGGNAGRGRCGFPCSLFSPFIADATVTLIRRWGRGEKLSQAHKTHYYQRALQMGLGHRGTAIQGYGLMFGCGASAIAGLGLSSGLMLLGVLRGASSLTLRL